MIVDNNYVCLGSPKNLCNLYLLYKHAYFLGYKRKTWPDNHISKAKFCCKIVDLS